MNRESAQIKSMMLQYFLQQRHIYGNEFVFSNMALKQHLWKPLETVGFQVFQKQMEDCRKCQLHRSRRQLVFGGGNNQASLMLIGEAPGEQEDRQGLPFVGNAGQLLDKILKAIGFEREDVYITNILKCRPPNNRDPLPEEIQKCLPNLKKQIGLIQPKIILALGRISGQTLLNTTQPLNRMRQKTHQFQDIPVMVTFHPAALLRNPQWKRNAWEDVKKLRYLYDRLVGDKGQWKPAKTK